MRISGFFLLFPTIAVFSAHSLEGAKTLRSLGKGRKTQKSSPISKEKVDKVLTSQATTHYFQGSIAMVSVIGEALKGLYLKVLLSKHRSIACPLPLALASDLPCGVCTCKWDLQLPSPGWLWPDFPRPRGWRVTTALGNPFCCGTALGNPLPAEKSALRKKPL